MGETGTELGVPQHGPGHAGADSEVTRLSGQSLDERSGSLELEQVGELDAVGDEWNELAKQTGNIFSTWEWNSIWWRHFGSERTLLATMCRTHSGRLVAVLPLYLWRERPFRVVRFLGHHAGDQLGPICVPRDRHVVSAAVAGTLARCDVDIFVGEHVPSDEEWSALLNAKILTRDSSPVLRFDFGGWEEFLASRSSNFRGTVRRRERRLMREHEIRYRLTTKPGELQKDLSTLFALHNARWAGEPTNFSRREAFHRDFAACAFERGWLRLWFLEVDGRPRAAWYGFRFGGIESFYQGGRDPALEWDRYSVGFVVLVHSVREAFEDGISEYRFLRGGEEYKYRFTNLDRSVETIGVARGVASRAALAAAIAARKSRLVKGAISP